MPRSPPFLLIRPSPPRILVPSRPPATSESQLLIFLVQNIIFASKRVTLRILTAKQKCFITPHPPSPPGFVPAGTAWLLPAFHPDRLSKLAGHSLLAKTFKNQPKSLCGASSSRVSPCWGRLCPGGGQVGSAGGCGQLECGNAPAPRGPSGETSELTVCGLCWARPQDASQVEKALGGGQEAPENGETPEGQHLRPSTCQETHISPGSGTRWPWTPATPRPPRASPWARVLPYPGTPPQHREPSLAPTPPSHLPHCHILSEAGSCLAPGQFPSPHPGAELLPGIAGRLRGGKWHFGESGRKEKRQEDLVEREMDCFKLLRNGPEIRTDKRAQPDKKWCVKATSFSTL